jgi:large subunit ribosomal protein L40
MYKLLDVKLILTMILIAMIRYHLYHPTTLMPRPLRFSRNRYLRHWTIHRAWQLFQHKQKQNQQLELQRQYQSMAAACEELRIGAGDGGRLFRKSMMKTGTWSTPERGGGVPIDYARGMMEWVGGPGVGVGESGGKPRIWDHDWKRA